MRITEEKINQQYLYYTKHQNTMDIIANETVSEHSCEINGMVREIADVPEGSPCFLCQMTDLNECIWDEIGDDIIGRGIEARIWFERTEGTFTRPASVAACDKAAHYACYRRYIFTISTWIRENRRVRIPTCVETNIRQRFPGDGVYVGFNQG